MLGLLIAGLVTLVVGLLAIGFGIPVKEFSFGNTLIVTGVLGVCTGLLLFALALVVRELKTVARALEASAGRPRDGLDPFAAQSAQVPGRVAGAGAGIPASHPNTGALPPETPAPWQSEGGSRERSRSLEPEVAQEAAPVPAPEPPEPAKKRRNLLFMSSKRDRAETTDAAADAEAPAPEPRVSFEDAWPAADRQAPAPPPRRAGRASDTGEGENTRPVPAPPPPIRRPAEAPPVTILKSGVVDGMAYSLYSDGSIEAQMPEGMIRFASIDELRHHLDQRGA